MKLSEHFSLHEFERSATAEKYHIDNHVPTQYIPVLQQLCRQVLEPLRGFVGGPVYISSGYRCNQLNVKVGGVYSSQHTVGEAADIQTRDLETAHRWFEWLEANTDFDQLILETANGKDYWIHVSCRKNRKANRHQVIRYLKKK